MPDGSSMTISKVQPYQQELALLKCQFQAQSRSMDTAWSSDFRLIPADALIALGLPFLLPMASRLVFETAMCSGTHRRLVHHLSPRSCCVEVHRSVPLAEAPEPLCEYRIASILAYPLSGRLASRRLPPACSLAGIGGNLPAITEAGSAGQRGPRWKESGTCPADPLQPHCASGGPR